MSTIKFEAAPLPAQMQTTSDAPRKKRKRAPAQGAADDCFTCLNRNLKCDRRRPYCSQCLDGGHDCAGYKTQLTWGVGVASRGKLRGLSLPVAGAKKTTADNTTTASGPKKRTTSTSKDKSSTPSPRSGAPNRASLPSSRNDNTTFRVSVSQATPTGVVTHPDSTPLRPASGQTAPIRIPTQNGTVGTTPPSLNIYHAIHGMSPASTVYPQSATPPPSYDKVARAHFSPYPTPSPTSQYFQLCPSQHQIPPTPTSHSSYPINPNQPAHAHAAYHQVVPVPYAAQREYVNHSAYAPQTSIPEPFFPVSVTATADDDDVEEIGRDFSTDGVFPDTISVASSSIPIDGGFSFPLSGANVVGMTPRMQYLIQYYAEVISPVIVAFDNPSNPMRNQILGLAARSESLQHAISALSASNIRQRRESGALSTGKFPGARRSSYMHLSLTNESWDDSQNLTTQERKREESLHKYAAVRMLNQQLANPHLCRDDSVLATLLMLCLFHICDSGIARFQTQFAGVKKLLTLRGNNFNGPNGDTKWMTRVFTLFDSVAATVNDREGQIDGQYVDISSQADGEWPYETLTGVDSRLFKSISRLGRLNVLSQGKSSETNSNIVSRPIPVLPYAPGQQDSDFGSFDGNGWMRIVSDEDLFNVKTLSPTMQEQFWREWREVRQDLQTWTFDNTRFDGSNTSQPYLTPDQRFDMCNISESFRYSALLYTERLADPVVPSTDHKIQEWVQKSLYHIKQVRSDVYLLWPLFITGAECGHEHERSVIRERCLDIQKDSGFMNNSSCLTLLEKVWQNDSAAARNRDAEQCRSSNNFRFRDVMLSEANEGEWIVV